MCCDPCSNRRLAPCHKRLDLSRRVQAPELMDGPCAYEELRDCLRHLGSVNRLLRTHSPTLRWLQSVIPRRATSAPCHILDVGCGGGDMLRRIEQWAQRVGVAVRLTGVDINPQAARAAREMTPTGSLIRWLVGDAYSFDTERMPVDIVISSLTAHHLNDDEIVRFVRWMESVAATGWFLNDLYRSRIAAVGFKALAGAMGWHQFVRHDGPVSVLRSFRPQEWWFYMQAAGIAREAVSMERFWPVRICVGRSKVS